jgi:hypothetical protein
MDSFLTDDLIDLMRKCLRLNSVVTVAFLALCSASGSNAEPDTAIEHAAAPVEPAQGPNMTVVPDRDANVSTAQTENDAAGIKPLVSIAPANNVTLSIAPPQLMAFPSSFSRV